MRPVYSSLRLQQGPPGQRTLLCQLAYSTNRDKCTLYVATKLQELAANHFREFEQQTQSARPPRALLSRTAELSTGLRSTSMPLEWKTIGALHTEEPTLMAAIQTEWTERDDAPATDSSTGRKTASGQTGRHSSQPSWYADNRDKWSRNSGKWDHSGWHSSK
jgi:hypothetical protein